VVYREDKQNDSRPIVNIPDKFSSDEPICVGIRKQRFSRNVIDYNILCLAPKRYFIGKALNPRRRDNLISGGKLIKNLR
jgi:hypothetical protein